MDREPRTDPRRPLRETEERPIGVSVPVPISKRLDLLVRRAESSGARVFRKDLVAALILSAPETADELLKLCLRYGKATASEAAVSDEPQAKVLELNRPGPGRRPRDPSRKAGG